MCLVLALSAVAVAFVSGPSLYGGMAISVFSFQDLSFIMKDCVSCDIGDVLGRIPGA